MVYFFSDAHFGHKNMCKGVSEWIDLDNCRDFNTIEDMNNAIIESINSTVKNNDTLYHVGDLSLGGWKNIWNFRKQIVCENIIQINGNHDIHIKNDKFFPYLEKKDNIIFEIEDKNNYRIMSMLKHKNDVTAHDMFKEVHDGPLRIIIDGQIIILDHYPYEIWPDMDEGAWHLHGHLHHELDCSETNTRYRRMDIGWIGKIYSFDDIKEIMNKREIKKRHS